MSYDGARRDRMKAARGLGVAGREAAFAFRRRGVESGLERRARFGEVERP